MHLKPSSQMGFTCQKMFSCFAELFLSGTVLILTSLNNKSKANKVAVAAPPLWLSLGNISGSCFYSCVLAPPQTCSCCMPPSKLLCFSILSPHFWMVFTIHLVHSQLQDCVYDLWAGKWDELMLTHICGVTQYGWNMYKAHVEEWKESVGIKRQQKLILISCLFS